LWCGDVGGKIARHGRHDCAASLRFCPAVLPEAARCDALGIVAALEQDLGVPVVQPIAARIWEIQRRLHVRQPIKGYGGLLETLPA
jgi:hypothetical protein